MATRRYKLVEGLCTLANALGGAGDPAVTGVQLAVPWPPEAELERTAGLLGVEVRAGVAERQFGPVRIVVSADAFR
jgi:hypothetical protein